MWLLLLLILLALLLFGVGFSIHVLWWLLVIAVAVILIGFLVRSADGGGRWYRW